VAQGLMKICACRGPPKCLDGKKKWYLKMKAAKDKKKAMILLLKK
jgi:hypothetical protein